MQATTYAVIFLFFGKSFEKRISQEKMLHTSKNIVSQPHAVREMVIISLTDRASFSDLNGKSIDSGDLTMKALTPVI